MPISSKIKYFTKLSLVFCFLGCCAFFSVSFCLPTPGGQAMRKRDVNSKTMWNGFLSVRRLVNLGDKIRQNLVLYFLDEIFNCAPSSSGEGQTAQGLGKSAGSENTEGSRSRSQSLLKGYREICSPGKYSQRVLIYFHPLSFWGSHICVSHGNVKCHGSVVEGVVSCLFLQPYSVF